ASYDFLVQWRAQGGSLREYSCHEPICTAQGDDDGASFHNAVAVTFRATRDCQKREEDDRHAQLSGFHTQVESHQRPDNSARQPTQADVFEHRGETKAMNQAK